MSFNRTIKSMAYVVYRGPSMLDGVTPIVGIIVPESSNTKTGPMSQLFIMHADIAPHVAQKSGEDAAVCGDCPFRPSLVHAKRAAGEREAKDMRPCYVKTFQGPRSTWESNKNVPVNLQHACKRLRGASLRLGAYGDPAALPEHVIAQISSAVDMRITGYTHQWRNSQFLFLKGYVMASCDSVLDYARAKGEGWRTFRVIQKRMLPVLAKREIVCPSEKVECIDCQLCDGVQTPVLLNGQWRNTRKDLRKDIAIYAH